jgi:CRISPR-associated protein (Cas_Cmr5)
MNAEELKSSFANKFFVSGLGQSLAWLRSVATTKIDSQEALLAQELEKEITTALLTEKKEDGQELLEYLNNRPSVYQLPYVEKLKTLLETTSKTL